MTEKVFQPTPDFAKNAHANKEKYELMYTESVSNPDAFWGEHGKRIDWITPFTKVKNTSFEYPNISIKWYEDGELNVCENCVDRHLESRGDQTAIIWESDDPNIDKHITYNQLHDHVSRLANVYKSLGVGKGDRVILYMPMIPEAAYAMLACARIGAIHSIVFGGFSPDALASRISDCKASLVVTADEGPRGGKNIPLKKNVDAALEICGDVKTLVVRRTGNSTPYRENRDFDYEELVSVASSDCPVEKMNAEDPLFILYTSGSTGKPKGVVHSSAGYLVYASMTHQYTFDYQEGDTYWCTADVGWITGHSYIVYGPLANGATTLMFEGTPTYPDASRFWAVCEKHKVNQFYTAPTAIRALMGLGDDLVLKHNLSDLRVLGTVGEPINPEAWNWYNEVVGKGVVPIVDTWWQTETGGVMISPLAGITPLKPCYATLSLPGIQLALMDSEGKEIEGNDVEGNLCVKFPWPSMIRTTWGDHERCKNTYFSTYNNHYFTGDGCKRDSDGMYRITGRVDDVINVSGHRLGTAEIEDAINQNEHVVESAVVGFPHDIKGQGIYAYVICTGANKEEADLRKSILAKITDIIGPIAKPDKIQIVEGLPKTRSGKIMRRILRKIAAGEDNFGDTSTLLDPSIVTSIKNNSL